MTATALELSVRLYTVIEAANLMGVSKSWVYEQIHAGRLPYVNIGVGKKYRIRHQDLATFLDEHTTTNTN